GQGFGADGMAVDMMGRLYATGPAGVYVFDNAGKSLGVIPTPRLPITIAFAGPAKDQLYIGAMGAVDPDGKAWATPEGVRNVAMTLYRLDTETMGPMDRPK
ncbi:MAG: SMP-30/gluconolactonase/LRE family protein, partial [Croceibacterium sp.]